MKPLVFLLASLMATCQQVNASDGARSTQMKLEELLQRLEQERPWTLEKIESVLGVTSVVDQANEYWTHYSAVGPVTLEEGVVVEKLDFGLNNTTQALPRFIVYLSDDSSCITRQRITQTYPDIQINYNNMPRGRSLNEQVYHIKKREWGDILFGFKVRRPDCLSSIIFRTEGS
jgi:hypothetical protein